MALLILPAGTADRPARRGRQRADRAGRARGRRDGGLRLAGDRDPGRVRGRHRGRRRARRGLGLARLLRSGRRGGRDRRRGGLPLSRHARQAAARGSCLTSTVAAAMASAIEISGVSKRFGRVRAVENLSFDVGAGRVTGFLGPNGAGKSTTLRMLLGLIRADAGTATFAGRRYAELPHPSAQVGAVLEHASFHPGRSGRDHLRVLAAAGQHPAARVDTVLAQVGLSDAADRRVKGYSMGMRQRLAIAAALLGDPEVLILDEPVNGLDPPGIRWIRGLLRAEAARGRAVLVSSHLLSEVAQSVDDVVVISQACCVRAGRWRRCSARRTASSRACGRPTPSGSPRCSASGGSRSSRTTPARCWSASAARGRRRDRGRASRRALGAGRGGALARGRVLRAHGGGDVRALLQAELIKLRTTRTFVALAVHRRRDLAAHHRARRPPDRADAGVGPDRRVHVGHEQPLHPHPRRRRASAASGVTARSRARCSPRPRGSGSSRRRRSRSRSPGSCSRC